MSSIVTEIIGLLTSGITEMASGIGQGLEALVKGIFMTGEGTTASPYALSTFGGVAIIFAGVA